MNRGAVAAAGALDELQRQGDRVYEVRIKGDRGAFVRALRGVHAHCQAADGENLTLVVPGASPQPIFAVASRLGVQVRHLRPQRRTLEDVFVQVTAGSEILEAAP